MRKQLEVPGTEMPNSIPELDAAVEKFKEASRRRKRAQDAEIAARDSVVECMKKHSLSVYEDLAAELVATLSVKETVRVEELGDNESNFESDADEESTPMHVAGDDLPEAKEMPL